MNSPRLFILLCLSLTAAAAHAADKEHAAEAAAAVVASMAESSVPVLPTSTRTPTQPSLSAGTAESLPDLPSTQSPVLSFRAMPSESAALSAKPSRITFSTQQRQGVSPLASMPLAGTARRLGAQRFNTDDGSMLDDFAICYRMSGRSSIEIIPGDPAPVKLPVVSMANNTGVTVGLVLRLSK